MKNHLNILVSAYACGPNWGSEIGMGWNWIVHLSNYCQLTVITERGFEKDIQEKLPDLNMKYIPEFHFIDIGEKGRELFWLQGSFSFYHYYRKWQKEAYQLALKLIEFEKFDIIHQLNMIGFREPGYLWKIEKTPFVWGPVGGVELFPYNFLKLEPFKSQLFLFAKNLFSDFQFYTSFRVKKAGLGASIIFASTNFTYKRLKRKFGDKVYLMNETGCEPREVILSSKDPQVIKLLWVGRLEGRKALPIALRVISELSKKINVELIIVGDGPMEHYYKTLARKMKIENKLRWVGRIPNNEVQNLMRESSYFFFTSVREGTPHVVTEALQNGLPVICHNACGQGTLINSNCGRKIELINIKSSVKEFTDVFLELYKDSYLYSELQKGATDRALEINWDFKAKEMLRYYKKIVVNHGVN